MCLSPISIDNPNYGNLNLRSGMPFINTTSQKIAVPCGHCSECIANKQMQLVQRVLMESMENHIFFTTLTYNDEMIPKVTTSTGYDLKFADVRDLSNMFKRLRSDDSFGRPFRYFAVSELGSKKGRPHFHILWCIPKFAGDDYNTCLNLQSRMYSAILSQWQRNVGSRRNPVYKPLLTLVRKYRYGRLHSTYDTHYCIPGLTSNGVADVAFYVLKYMMKPSTREVRLQRALHLNLPDDEYESVWSLVRPRYMSSLMFGLSPDQDGVPSLKIVDYLHSNLKRGFGKFDYPVFVNPITGQFFPLSRYYRQFPQVFSAKDAFDVYYSYTGPEFRPLKSSDQKIKEIDDYFRLVDRVDSKGAVNELDF